MTTTDQQPDPGGKGAKALAWWVQRPFARSFLLLWSAGAVITFFGIVVLDSESTTAIGNDFFYAAWLVALACPVWALARHLGRRRQVRSVDQGAARRH